MIYLIFDCIAENRKILLNDEFEKYAWVHPRNLKNYDLNAPTKITFQQKGFQTLSCEDDKDCIMDVFRAAK